MALSSAHAQIAKILGIEKEAHWLENKHLPTDEIQRQWAEKSAPLAAVIGVSAPTHPIDLNCASGQTLPLQDAQTTSPPVSTASSRRRNTNNTARNNLTALDSVDQPQAPEPMSHKRSSHSNHGPFVSTQAAAKPRALDSWQTDNEGPFSAFTVPASPRPAKARKTVNGCLPIQIPESSTGIREYDPADYIQRSQATLSPAFSPHMRSRRNSYQQRSPVSPLSQSPATLSDGFTNLTSISSADMQRQDSLGGSSLYGGLNMMRLDSRRSEVMIHTDNKADNSPLSQTPSFLTTSPSDVPAFDFSLSVSHAGGVVDDPEAVSNQFVSDNLDLSLGSEEDASMVRTISSESCSSQKSRISRRSEEQAVLSARPIAPKDSTESMSRQASSSSSAPDMARQLSADGSKVAIEKAKYTRPPHEKVYCSLCNIKPEGFRGPHELRRHVENKHGATRKMWVCKDTSPDQLFLSKCKACREKKTYGAYYNAGAHLRRIHFNPREKGKKSDKSAKARGGDGGGDYPPMDTLKLWMEEIDVPLTKNTPPSNESEDEEAAYPDLASYQNDLDNEGYDTLHTLPDLSSPLVHTNSSHEETRYQQYALPANDGSSVPLGYPSTENGSSFGFTNHEETFSNSAFPSNVTSNMSESYDPYATNSFSAPTVATPQLNTNARAVSFQNHFRTPNGFQPADLSFNSSINSPADHHDPFGPDFFDFS